MLDFTADGHNFNLASRQFDDEYLEHWGIKGMKWGRRRFQNKDGSLTPEGKKRYDDDPSNDIPETEEHKQARRNRALRSTNAKELYDNRDVLTTGEINERLSRLDAEKRLARAMEESLPKEPPKKTFVDRVDKALVVGRKLSEVYDFMQKPAMKALAKKMGLAKIEPPKKFNLDKFMENIDTKSNQEVADTLKRVTNTAKLQEAWKKAKDKHGKDLDKALADIAKSGDTVTEDKVIELIEEYAKKKGD